MKMHPYPLHSRLCSFGITIRSKEAMAFQPRTVFPSHASHGLARLTQPARLVPIQFALLVDAHCEPC
ncbi:predicted protein [Botrytis cinerea T4]|uniref:Uncharacterized protein n=1 Tax=Botryotinia fuckeliana (strain T4) TaxID=999810 RepID=G2YTC3_BOTF4|nr:predicted protein [Botrytis cinerea T4]